MDYPVSKGQKLEAEVIRWADAGKGVAQIGGLNGFVDQAMPGGDGDHRHPTALCTGQDGARAHAFARPHRAALPGLRPLRRLLHAAHEV